MGTKILTVDDSATVRRIIKEGLKPFHCDVIEAQNGSDGLAMVEKEKPDLVILDINMPEMNGMEMLEKMHEQTQFKDIPVIMLTTESETVTVKKAVQDGARDFLIKPFKIDELIDKVAQCLSLEKALQIKIDDLIDKVTLEKALQRDTEAEKVEINSSTVDGVHFIHFKGEDIKDQIKKLKIAFTKRIEDLGKTNMKKLCLDFNEFKGVDATVLELILHIKQLCQKKSIEMKLICLPELESEYKNFGDPNSIQILKIVDEVIDSFK